MSEGKRESGPYDILAEILRAARATADDPTRLHAPEEGVDAWQLPSESVEGESAKWTDVDEEGWEDDEEEWDDGDEWDDDDKWDDEEEEDEEDDDWEEEDEEGGEEDEYFDDEEDGEDEEEE